MIKPSMYRILVKVHEVRNTTKSGIVTMSDTQARREFYGHLSGELMDVGPHAFKSDEFEGLRPEIGQRVLFARYSGEMVEYPAESGHFYRIMNDVDVIAILEGEEDVDIKA